LIWLWHPCFPLRACSLCSRRVVVSGCPLLKPWYPLVPPWTNSVRFVSSWGCEAFPTVKGTFLRPYVGLGPCLRTVQFSFLPPRFRLVCRPVPDPEKNPKVPDHETPTPCSATPSPPFCVRLSHCPPAAPFGPPLPWSPVLPTFDAKPTPFWPAQDPPLRLTPSSRPLLRGLVLVDQIFCPLSSPPAFGGVLIKAGCGEGVFMLSLSSLWCPITILRVGPGSLFPLTFYRCQFSACCPCLSCSCY